MTNLTLPNNNGINLKLTACKIVNTRPCKMVRLAVFLSFAWVANSRPRNSRDFAAQIIWLTDFRAKERLLAFYVRGCKKGNFSIDDDDGKWIRIFSNFVAFIQFAENVKCRRIYLRVYFVGTALKLRKSQKEKFVVPCLLSP